MAPSRGGGRSTGGWRPRAGSAAAAAAAARGGGVGGGGGNVAINKRLTGARGAAELLAVVSVDVARFNAVNVCTTLQRLARLAQERGGGGDGSDDALDALASRASAAFSAELPAPRQVSGILWACAKLGAAPGARGACLRARLAPAQAAAEGVLAREASLGAHFRPQELSNALWAVAKSGRVVEGGEDTGAAIDALANAAEASLRRIGTDARARESEAWAPQALSNVAWALGTIAAAERSVRDSALPAARALATCVRARRAELNPQEVANTLWAFGRLVDAYASANPGGADAPFAADARALAGHASEATAGTSNEHSDAARGRAIVFPPRQLASCVWGCAKLGCALGGLLRAVGSCAQRRQFNAQEACMCAYALGASGADAASPDTMAVFDQCAEGMCTPSGGREAPYSAQQLSMVASAAAKLGLAHPSLIDALITALGADAGAAGCVGEGEGVLSRADTVDLVNLTWAVAKLRGERAPKRLVAPLAVEATRRAASSTLTLRHAVTLLWSLATAAHREESAVRALVCALADLLACEQSQVRMPSTRDLSDLAWALGSLRPQAEACASDALSRLLPALGEAAADAFDRFNSQELLKLLTAYERAGGECARLAGLASAERTLSYDFPAIEETPSRAHGCACGDAFDVKLAAAVPRAGGEGEDRVDDSCGGTGRSNTGVALWQGSYFLAEWLARVGACLGGGKEIEEGAAVLRSVLPRKGGWACEDFSWADRIGVELGAGLGLPSIVAARRLGVRMVATDGDADTLSFLRRNARANSRADDDIEAVSVRELRWGDARPLAAIELERKPDLLLASDVVYGNDESKWRDLVQTISHLSGRHTLVLLANMQRYPVHHPLSEDRFFSATLAEAGFEVKRVPQAGLHPRARGTGGANSCALYACRKASKEERKTAKAARKAAKKGAKRAETGAEGANNKGGSKAARKAARKAAKRARREEAADGTRKRARA